MRKTRKTKRYQSAYSIFFNAMEEDGLYPILKAANEIFNCPVLLTDKQYRLIHQIPNEPIGEYIWDTLYENKRLPENVIWDYQKLYLSNKTNEYQPFYANWGLVKNYPRIFGEINKDGQIIGHIAIFIGENELKEDDIGIAEIFIKAIKIKLQSTYYDRTIWKQVSSNCLLDLLNVDSTEQTKKLAADNILKQSTGDYVFMVTQIGESANKKAFANCAISELSSSYANVVAVIYKNAIVILYGNLSGMNRGTPKNANIGRIVDYLSSYHMVCGISEEFTDLGLSNVYYTQALITSELVAKDCYKVSGHYSDYAPMPLFYSVVKSIEPTPFIHPIINRVKEYDKENNTEFLETLRVYSIAMHNKEVSSNKLSIHRNTLLYRLNRIKELFDLSYEKENVALDLLVSFLLLDVMEKYEYEIG